jgi:thioredoxin-related protein
MKRLILLFLIISLSAAAQTKPKIYHPEADAQAELNTAIAKAKNSSKHVFVQVGGNWCSWCLLFHDLVQKNDTLSTYMKDNYEVLHLNFSPENKNEETLAKLGYPQRFGFPVFVILNGDGQRLHTQNSAYLEEGKGHSTKKVFGFLQDWAPAAVSPATYSKK